MFVPDLAYTTHILTVVDLTVNSDARCKCLVSLYPRRYYRPSEHKPPECMDQFLSCSDCKFHLIGV